jgi:hypothetical protein
MTPQQIWEEYSKGTAYKTAIGLYEDVEYNTNFYLGKQWEGVNAPNIEKPVVNLFKPAIDYYVSMLASDDIGVTCDFPQQADAVIKEVVEYITQNQLESVLEATKLKAEARLLIKDSALNGDGYFHFWFDPDKKNGDYTGDICLERVQNVNLIFGNPADGRIEHQPYLIVSSQLPTESVKEMVSEPNSVQADAQEFTNLGMFAESSADYTTVLTKFWKKNGTVWFTKVTHDVIIKKPTDTKCKLYPIARMCWTDVPLSCHGRSPLTSVRQNQITVNKFYMMFNEFFKKLAFPKVVYDKQKIATWSNQIQAIGVDGDPQNAFAYQTPVVQLPSQIREYVQDLIIKTKETLGVYDVALGNARPENTSAIIALQKTAAQPLELQRLNFYQMIEDSVRIIIDLMASYYGVRQVPFKMSAGEGELKAFDYADLRDAAHYTVDVGQAAYWAETTQIQTLDNLFKSGIIPDPITYLEQLPNGTVKNKADIIQKLREQTQVGQFDQAIQAQQPPNLPPVI